MKELVSKRDNLSILVLKFPYSSNYGGGEFHTLALCQGLRKKGAKIYLASSCKVLLEEFRKRGWPCQKVWAGIEPVTAWSVLIFPILAPFVFLRLAWLLFWYKIKKKIDIVYCLSLTEKILATPFAKLLGMKVFWIEHLRIERWLISNPFKLNYVLNSRWACLIAVSEAVARQLTALGIRPQNVEVIYNGVDLKQFSYTKRPRREKLIVGTVSRLCLEKGLDSLLWAAKLVLEKEPQIEFRIIGIGPEEQRLKDLSKNLGINSEVRFLGFQRNIPKSLSQFDIFALTPIRRESFGIAAAEAMATGLPVVATDISGLPEVVKDKVTGFVVPPGNSKAIASAIIKLVKNQELRDKMGKEGRKRVEKMFTLEKMLNEFYRLFSTCV